MQQVLVHTVFTACELQFLSLSTIQNKIIQTENNVTADSFPPFIRRNVDGKINIEIGVKKFLGREGVDWIRLSCDRDEWRVM